jgi:peptidase S24-like protein
MPQTSLHPYRQIAQEVVRGEALHLTVTGASMAPMLRPNDVVWVLPVAGWQLSPGDIVVVQHGPEWITHRLLRTDSHQCYTYGDNLHTLDAPSPLTDIVGRVVAIERNGETVDLQRGAWQIADRLIRRSGRWKMRILSAAYPLDRLAGSWRIGMGTLLVWPFQLVNRVVVWLAGKC